MGDAWIAGNFSKMQKRLPSDAVKRRMVLENIVLIHNFRTEMVGLNQIKSVFDLEYERTRTLEGYDRIRQYCFQPGGYNTDDDESCDL